MANGPRQEQVIELLLQGCSNKEIGNRLGMAERTVKAHMNRLFLKYQINDPNKIKRVELAVKIYQEKYR